MLRVLAITSLPSNRVHPSNNQKGTKMKTRSSKATAKSLLPLSQFTETLNTASYQDKTDWTPSKVSRLIDKGLFNAYNLTPRGSKTRLREIYVEVTA